MLVAAGTSLAVLAALAAAVWAVSVRLRDVSIVDIFWGPAFGVAAIVYLLTSSGGGLRGPLVVALVWLWGARLALHIFLRGRGKGEDFRYREMRERNGPRFVWTSLFTVFLLQAVLSWAISLPLLGATASDRPLGPIDLLASIVFAAGFVVETLADLQLTRFKGDPANRGKVMQRGLWRYSRHPNYFGDAVVWWGLYAFCVAGGGPLWMVFGPALMTFLLLRVSGVALLEKSLASAKPGYREYVERTSAFVPWPPRRG